MSYLLDTNVWLERLLDQEQADEVAELLVRAPLDRLYVTDFTLHSIGVILHRLKQPQTFLQFVQDVLLDGAIALLSVPPDGMAQLVSAAAEYLLDFDDAYQYVAAINHSLTIVSFDADFDRTDCGRSTPREILREFDATVEDD